IYELLFFFFFQAEDGIRDPLVTGVQTCALPICQARFPATISPLLPLVPHQFAFLCVASAGQPHFPEPRRLAGISQGTTGIRTPQIGRASCRERVQMSVVACSLTQILSSTEYTCH